MFLIRLKLTLKWDCLYFVFFSLVFFFDGRLVTTKKIDEMRPILLMMTMMIMMDRPEARHFCWFFFFCCCKKPAHDRFFSLFRFEFLWSSIQLGLLIRMMMMVVAVAMASPILAPFTLVESSSKCFSFFGCCSIPRS